jgi:hypothetical protein
MAYKWHIKNAWNVLNMLFAMFCERIIKNFYISKDSHDDKRYVVAFIASYGAVTK